MDTRTCTIETPDGRSLHVYEAGAPDGAPIVFHHGTPSAGAPYEPHIRAAEEQGVRLVSFDRAGYGRSSRNAGRAVADVAADVATIADALAIERFATWGLSGGGPHALATTALLGDRVVAVATMASVGPTARRTSTGSRAWARETSASSGSRSRARSRCAQRSRRRRPGCAAPTRPPSSRR